MSDKSPLTVFVDHEDPEYPTCWVDSKENPLESRIREIAIALIVIGEMHHRANELHRYQCKVEAKVRAEAELRQQQEAARQATRAAELREQRRREDWLFQQAASLRRAEDIRALVQRIATHPNAAEQSERLQEWTAWALAQAARIDPLSNPIDDLFLPPTPKEKSQPGRPFTAGVAEPVRHGCATRAEIRSLAL